MLKVAKKNQTTES